MTHQNLTAIKALTFVMFMMFAMTTDSVGIIIPEIIRTFHLSLTAAGSFQYATMSGIALAGFLLGHLADVCRAGPSLNMVVDEPLQPGCQIEDGRIVSEADAQFGEVMPPVGLPGGQDNLSEQVEGETQPLVADGLS